jgi:hypothetical protein
MPEPSAAKVQQPDRSFSRRIALGGVALLLLAPLLAACKEVEPGSGIQTIRRQKELQPGGR